MRKHYIDNLRNFTILLLFPVHTWMIWNDFGSRFYIWQGGNRLLSTLIVAVNPWFMPLLFVLAGMSARYALEKRSRKEFVIGRVQKLLVPFLFGTVFLVPVQTFFARKFFDGYSGGWLENLNYFFTHWTDLSGYDGAFTPGQLWFVLFLFVISMVSLLLFRILPYQKVEACVGRLPVWGILLCFVPVWLMYYLGNFGGFSLGKDLALYLLGYYVLSNDAVLEKLKACVGWLAVAFGAVTAVSVALYARFAYYGDLWVNFVGWVSVLALLAIGQRFLNRKTCVTNYLNRASYPIYLLHQSVLVALAYAVVQGSGNLLLQVSVICFGSLALTVLAYHLIGLVPGLRSLIGIRRAERKRGKNNEQTAQTDH